jgi:predicted nucleotidyltransferase
VIGAAELARVVDTIVALYNPDRIYVFGSFAKGTLHEDSDLDLLVVKPSSLPRFRRGRDLNAFLATMAFSVDVLFYTPEEMQLELADPHSMLSVVMPSANRLYERGSGSAHARR